MLTGAKLRGSRLFHQAEDGIREADVTGVQTCALLISSRRRHTRCGRDWSSDVCSSDLSYSACVAEVDVDPETGIVRVPTIWIAHDVGRSINSASVIGQVEGSIYRSEERRVGKECRSRWSPYH